MPAVDDLLADLAAHPPSEPTPVGEIRGRARRRTRRRRALAGLAAAVVLVAVGVGVGAAVTADSGEEVVADDGGTTPSRSTTVTTSTAPPLTSTEVPVATVEPTMTLDPASGYVDGTVVEMALDEPATGPALVAQCAAEALGDGSAEILPYCTTPIEMRAEALRPFTLERTVDTPDGVVDCAAAVGRCTLGVRIGGAASADDRYAPLAFRSDLPAMGEPAVEVDGDDGTVADGDTLLIDVTGVETGDVVSVDQCLPDPGDGDGPRCSAARGRTATVIDGPETQLSFTAFHDVLLLPATSGLWSAEWTACEPCVLRVRVDGRTLPVATVPLAMEATAEPLWPTLELDPSGPHAGGDVVTVRGAHLQPETTAEIAWCMVLPPQGGGDSPCNDPGGPGSVPVEVTEDGTFTLRGYELPDEPVQNETCGAEPGVCGIGLHEVDWFAYSAIVPLDLGG